MTAADPADPAAPAVAAYERIVAALEGEPDVALGRMFRSVGLNFRGKYFALLSRGEFVVKLPADRVVELTAAGVGRPFEPGPGRRMREWLTSPPDRRRRWPALAREALAFGRANAEAH
jgi:hypothetical protein